MRNKLIKLVSRSTRCRLFWDHFKTCWDVCGAFEDINLDKLNHKHNNKALSLFQFWDISTMFGTFRDKFFFGTFWDISGHPLSMCTNDQSSIQPRREDKK